MRSWIHFSHPFFFRAPSSITHLKSCIIFYDSLLKQFKQFGVQLNGTIIFMKWFSRFPTTPMLYAKRHPKWLVLWFAMNNIRDYVSSNDLSLYARLDEVVTFVNIRLTKCHWRIIQSNEVRQWQLNEKCKYRYSWVSKTAFGSVLTPSSRRVE